MNTTIQTIRLDHFIKQVRASNSFLSPASRHVVNKFQEEKIVPVKKWEMDALLPFYRLLSIGVLAEYFSTALNPDISEQLQHIDGDKQYAIGKGDELVDLLIGLHRSGHELSAGLTANLTLFEEFLIFSRDLQLYRNECYRYDFCRQFNVRGRAKMKQQVLKFETEIREGLFLFSGYWENKQNRYAHEILFSFLQLQELLMDFSQLMRKSESVLLAACFWTYYRQTIENLSKNIDLLDNLFGIVRRIAQMADLPSIATTENRPVISIQPFGNWKDYNLYQCDLMQENLYKLVQTSNNEALRQLVDAYIYPQIPWRIEDFSRIIHSSYITNTIKSKMKGLDDEMKYLE